jgi:hypothetical protein
MSDRKDHDDDPFAFKTLASEIDRKKKNKPELMSEYGSPQSLRHLSYDNVKGYDAENNEICIPKCQKCGIHKCQIIGKNVYMWFCSMCGEQ